MGGVRAGATPAGQDVQRNRHVQFLRSGPEWIVVEMAVWFILRRRTPDQDAADAYFAAAFEFLNRRGNITQVDRTKADQPLPVMTAIFGRPVIEAAKAG